MLEVSKESLEGVKLIKTNSKKNPVGQIMLIRVGVIMSQLGLTPYQIFQTFFWIPDLFENADPPPLSDQF